MVSVDSRWVRPVVVAGFALFAMFFGAGNVILPAMMGVEAGPSSYVAVAGFVTTGALLTVAGMLAAATLRKGEQRIADRVGVRFGLIFTSVLFLSTGMLYPTPRVAAVSFEMAAAPVFGSGPVQLFFYSLFFFGVCYLLVRKPGKVVDRVGRWLTPALLVVLVVMVAASYTLPDRAHRTVAPYTEAPFADGLIQGYFTMDSLATLMYGTVIMGSLAAAGFSGRRLRRGTAAASVMAGVLLALCYVSLIQIGKVGEGSNGAVVITGVSRELFGFGGQMLFGVIIFLACLTTALGLLESSSMYFHRLVPRWSQHTWLVIHLVVVFAISNLGLETILKVVAPLNQLLYPVTICLIVVALVEAAMPGMVRLQWTYRVPAYVAVFLSVFEALWSTHLPAFATFRGFLDLLPLGALQMTWVVPAVVGFGLGLVLDARRIRTGARTPRVEEGLDLDHHVRTG